MEIIGEKINGTRKRVARAIQERDAGFVLDLAVKQAEAGATWLDINAGTLPAREPEDLIWLVQTIQPAVQTPLCLDSANPAALSAALEIVDQTPLINSISGEQERLDGILPLVAQYNCPVVALAMSDAGIPATQEGRMEVVHKMMEATRSHGVPDNAVYIDPLVMTIATDTDSALITLDTMRAILGAYPDVHLTMGLSNVSFGLPARSHINRAFMTLALQAGLDSAIIDPLDSAMQRALKAAELVLGRDRHCLNYARAYRAGLFSD